MKKAHKKFNSWIHAAASYNRGIKGYEKAIVSQKIDNYFNLYLNKETSRYVFRLLAIKEIFENPDKYGFILKKEDYYYSENLIPYKVTKTIPNLANWALEHNSNYKDLKRYNPWLRKNILTIKIGKTYNILLPNRNDKYEF